MERLVVLVLVVAAVCVLALAYRRRTRNDVADTGHDLPPVPAPLVDGSAPTWVIFTTPLCASCGSVEAELREAFPAHRVVKVDATEQPDLAATYRVRRAPTVVLASRDGEVRERLVGPEAVRAHLAAATC